MPQAPISAEKPVPSGPDVTGLEVLMMPDFRNGNPYQSLLSKSISELGCDVSFPSGYRRVLPLYRAIRDRANSVRILHLHWLTPYLRGKTLPSYVVYVLKLYLDLCLVRLSGVKIVWTIHNKISHESRFPRLELWAMRRVAASASKVIVHSQAALAELEGPLGLERDRTAVIPHGHYREVYHTSIDQAAARKKLELPSKTFIYLCFGLVRKYKNIEQLLLAWEKWRNSLPGSLLLLAGEALDPEYGEQITRLTRSCPDVLLHLRHVPTEEVHLYFSAADVVVLPFERTLTSGSLLLAMSFEKPVVAPRFGVIAETVGAADDLLYDPLNDDSLGEALRLAACLDSAANAKKTRIQCDQFAWRAIAQTTVCTYLAA
jgi:glycosyltransferase involved in cell wall biosynthesis